MGFTPPTAEQIALTIKNLGADEKSLKEAKTSLIEWLQLQPHLPDDIDERRLEQLYINCKCSLQRSKIGLDAYFSLRSRLPEVLQNRDPLLPEMRALMNDVSIFPMAQLTPEGYRVQVSFGVVRELSNFDPDAYVKLFLMMEEVRLAEDCVTGDVYIIDCKDYTMGHVAAFGATRVRKMEMCLKTAYCSRIKAVHFINASQVMELLYKILVNTLSTKLIKRVHMHSKSTATLLEHMPAECLPNEIGGNAGPAADIWEEWKSKLISHRDWFIEQDTVRSDETKRPGRDPYGDGLFGCEGSFRKLQLD